MNLLIYPQVQNDSCFNTVSEQTFVTCVANIIGDIVLLKL